MMRPTSKQNSVLFDRIKTIQINTHTHTHTYMIQPRIWQTVYEFPL